MTAALQLSQERVTLLGPADVQRYLLTHDWDEDRIASSAKGRAFRSRRSPEITVLVPRDRKFSDYALRVGDVLQTLAVIQRRKAWEVLEDLLASRQTPPRRRPWRHAGARRPVAHAARVKILANGQRG